MSKLPRELRTELRVKVRTLVSETSDDAIDLVVNLTGKYLDERKRQKLKKEAELDFSNEIENAIAKTYNIGLTLREDYEQKRIQKKSIKEKFYLITDSLFKSIMPEIPKNIHAMDYFFQNLEELSQVQFNLGYLKSTRYMEYLKSLAELTGKIKEAGKIEQAWEVLNEFKDSIDFYLVVQVTLQKLFDYYEFLASDFSEIKKMHVDMYLEIYEEMSGLYEKLVSLIATLIHLLQGDHSFKYEAARRTGLPSNMLYIEKANWGIFVSDFDRNMRNAIVHKTCSIDIVKEKVRFVDRKKTITVTFREVQKKARELSALLLILPHVLISIFCMSFLSFKDVLESLP